MKLSKIIFVLFIVPFILVACGHSPYTTKGNGYFKKPSISSPLIVPAGAVAPAQEPYYTVPSRKVIYVPGSKPPSLLPPGLPTTLKHRGH